MRAEHVPIQIRKIIKPLPAPRPLAWIAVRFWSIGGVLLFCATAAVMLPTIGLTNSIMTDSENSRPAHINLGTLDFVMATTTGEICDELVPDQGCTREVSLANTGNLDFQYKVSAQDVLGDDDTCGFMLLNAYFGADLVYEGSLIGFNFGPVDFATSTANWIFELKFPGEALNQIDLNDNCEFKFVFDGWQPVADNPSAGFTDREEIAIGTKINKDGPRVKVLYPNGGEQWYIVADDCLDYAWCRNWCSANGMNNKCEYEIKWDAKTGGRNSNSALLVDVWYSTDSGRTWLVKIANHVPNTGKFLWKIPVENIYVSDKARVKVAAYDKQNELVWAWDQSDVDFCPPILMMEDLMNRMGADNGHGGFIEGSGNEQGGFEMEAVAELELPEEDTLLEKIPFMTAGRIKSASDDLQQNGVSDADTSRGEVDPAEQNPDSIDDGVIEEVTVDMEEKANEIPNQVLMGVEPEGQDDDDRPELILTELAEAVLLDESGD